MVFKLIVGLLALASCVFGISISGIGSVDSQQASAGGRITFPRIPGLNSQSGSGSSNPIEQFLGNITPEIQSIVERIQAANGTQNITIPRIPNLTDLSELANLPEVQQALQQARQNLQTALNIGENIAEGIRNGITKALSALNPVGAILRIIRTIIKVHVEVARRVFIFGGLIVHEGLRLAGQVIESLQNVAIGAATISPPRASVTGSASI